MLVSAETDLFFLLWCVWYFQPQAKTQETADFSTPALPCIFRPEVAAWSKQRASGELCDCSTTRPHKYEIASLTN